MFRISQVRCPSCYNKGSPICKSCYKRYLLINAINPICMICKCNWSLALIQELLGNDFLTKIREQRREVSLKREYALVDNEKVNIPAIKLKMDKKTELRDNKKQRAEYHREWKRLLNEGRTIEHEMRLLDGKITKKYSLIFKCPQDCDGVVNPDTESCTKCNIDVCMDCGKKIPYKRVHECKTEDIDSMNLLKLGSKNCPKCSTVIFKADGCDQMFCTVCYTAFNWDTLKIVDGPIHNPHYFELVNNGVISARTGARNGDITFYDLRGSFGIKYPPEYDKLLGMLIQNSNIENEDHIQRINQGYYQKMKKLRERFLLENISETAFNNAIVRLENKHEFDMLQIQYRQSIGVISQVILQKLLEMLKKTIIDTGICTKDIAEINWTDISEFYISLEFTPSKEVKTMYGKFIKKCLKEMKKWVLQMKDLVGSYDKDVAIYKDKNPIYEIEQMRKLEI